MDTAALTCTIVGAFLSTGAAIWLLVGFSPTNPKYTDDGALYPGQQESRVVPALLRGQRHVAALVACGATLQLLGAVLAVLPG